MLLYCVLNSVLLFVSVASIAAGSGCDSHQGCRIQQGQCLCGIGCRSDYIYASKEECRTALKGRRNDICQRSPCLNGGACSQTSISPGYRCRCEGTGYYGSRCHNSCPRASTQASIMPYECIVI